MVVVKVMNQEQASMQVGPEQSNTPCQCQVTLDTWHDELPAEDRRRLNVSDKIRDSSGHMLTINIAPLIAILQQSCDWYSILVIQYSLEHTSIIPRKSYRWP